MDLTTAVLARLVYNLDLRPSSTCLYGCRSVVSTLPVTSFVPRHTPSGETFAHSAFLYDLVAIAQPSVAVELGTDDGDSYFALCQSVLEHKIDSVCYAVLANEGCAARLNSSNEAPYASYSHLLATDTPADFFSGIEFLHITSSATQNIDGWIDQVKPGGWALFSGIDRRDGYSRTRWYWERISAGDRFTFHDGAGLGVWRKPGGLNENDSPLLSSMFDSSIEAQEYVRRYYLIYNGYVRGARVSAAAERKTAELLSELQAGRHEVMTLELELKQAQFERNEALRQAKQLESLQLGLEAEKKGLQEELNRLSTLLENQGQTVHALTNSLSWRFTEPLRWLSALARGRKR